MDPIRWRQATQRRARQTIRDWQLANRVVLSKEAAEDLADRFASALTDAIALGETPPVEKAAASD